ncbi:unnamed protein product [Candidula unifasciata]|uniref:Uncharacterized protein n=1 Tax=Candidula unifasciata TaxID=100452 RepID=A0A8S4A3T4_9EUPU|nr:unnamed protein product [Candidula unifasciata]
MDYARSHGVSVMLPVTSDDLQKPVFKKYWSSNVAKRSDVPRVAGVNKIDMSKFANLESFFKQQSKSSQEAPIEPVPAVPAPEVSPTVAERPVDPQSRDPYSGSEYIFGLTGCNFRPFLERKDIALVMFYGDEGEEKAMWARAQVNKAARTSQRENHGYAAVNCALNPGLCQSEGVCKTPMYKVYSRGNVLSTIQEVCTIHAKELKMLVENAPLLAQPRGPVPCS